MNHLIAKCYAEWLMFMLEPPLQYDSTQLLIMICVILNQLICCSLASHQFLLRILYYPCVCVVLFQIENDSDTSLEPYFHFNLQTLPI